MRRWKGTAVAVSLVAAVALVACGSDDGSVSIRSGGGDTPSLADDVAAAQRVVLSAADLPGYRAEPPPEPDATSAQAAAAFQHCLGAGNVALGDAERTAQSPGFRKGTATSVSSLATIAADEPIARSAMADLSRPDLEPCVTGLLRVVLERDLRLPVNTASSQLLAAPKAGDQSVTWRTTVQVTFAGQPLAAHSDLTFVRDGRTLASLFDFQIGDPFPTAERDRLVNAMAARMQGI
jgi:hypothetical protein